MKNLKRVLLLLAVIIVVAVVYNYPKLNLLAGYAAKNTASSVFIGNRSLEFTNKTDNSFTPIHLAKNEVNTELKTATSSAFGLLKRTAFYREGLGAVLALEKSDIEAKYLVPKRVQADNLKPYPYGDAPQKDTIFTTVDYEQLNKAIDVLFKDTNQTRVALVVYKNQIIAERYAEGFDKNAKILGWSMTKSITSTMFGILAYQQKINLQSKAPIAEWQNDERKEITIHNLLQMNSGLEWEEEYASISDATKMLFLSRDVTKSQIDKPLVGKPNASWNYSSGTTNLLSGILRQQFKTHQEYLDFWYSALIDKIGMNSMLLEADLEGNYIGSSYAWATPRDWAKLGLLYLHNGNWDGTEVFNKEWVTYATTPTPTSDNGYGAQIWLNKGGKYPDVPKSMYYFSGFQGQNVFIFPEHDLVVVRMGLTKNADMNVFLKSVLASIHN